MNGGLDLCKLPGFARLDSPFDFSQGRLGALSLHKSCFAALPPGTPALRNLRFPVAADRFSGFLIGGAASLGFSFVPELLTFGEG